MKRRKHTSTFIFHALFCLLLFAWQSAQAGGLLNINFSAHLNPGYVAKTGLAATGLTTNDYWNVYSRDVTSQYDWRADGVLTNLSWSTGEGSTIGLAVTNAAGYWSGSHPDPMYNAYLHPSSSGNVTIVLTNLPAGLYEVYAYGHGAANSQNTSFGLYVDGSLVDTKATTTTGNWSSTTWTDGWQYVKFSAIEIGAGEQLKFIASPGSSSYAPVNGLQLVRVGDLPVPAANVINVNFSAHLNPGYVEKEGRAATGADTNDYWNVYSRDVSSQWDWRANGVLTNLLWADSTSSYATLAVTNAQGYWSGSHPDAMYNSYLYPSSGGDVTLVLTDLQAGYYDVYLYGHGDAVDQNSVFEIYVDGVLLDNAATTTNSTWSQVVWEEGIQYVKFADIPVGDGKEVTIIVSGGATSYAPVNGMQLVWTGSLPLLNVNFAAHLNPGYVAKTGLAATGDATNDFWNVYSRDVTSQYDWRANGVLTNLSWSMGASSTIGLAVTNAAGYWAGSHSDPMYNAYLYPSGGGNVTMVLTNLPAGLYEVYAYGHGAANSQNTSFGLYVNGSLIDTKATTTTSNWSSTTWTDGWQYVKFSDIEVGSGEELKFIASPGSSSYAPVNGLQLRWVGYAP